MYVNRGVMALAERAVTALERIADAAEARPEQTVREKAIEAQRLGQMAKSDVESDSPPCGNSGCLHNCAVCVRYYDLLAER